MYVSITCITWVIGDIFVANMYMYNLGYRIDPLSTLRLIMVEHNILGSRCFCVV